jgi:hypothetical protein
MSVSERVSQSVRCYSHNTFTRNGDDKDIINSVPRSGSYCDRCL